MLFKPAWQITLLQHIYNLQQHVCLKPPPFNTHPAQVPNDDDDDDDDDDYDDDDVDDDDDDDEDDKRMRSGIRQRSRQPSRSLVSLHEFIEGSLS